MNYLKKNWFSLLLVLALVVILVLYFGKRNVTTTTTTETTEQITPADGAGALAPTPAPVPVTGQRQTLYCLQLDGRQDGHLPALMGNKATEAYANGLDGYNWSLTWTSSGSEPYGILPDGTLFAKESFLREYGMVSVVALKCDDTNWSPVNLEKGVVNNEPAYTYKLK